MNHTNPVYPATFMVNLEEISIFWEVIILIPVRKKAHMNMCLILNGYQVGDV